MSISYSGLRSHAKVTLPSVSDWGQSNSIIRDPPSSITTRRIDRVGDTSCLTEEIDGSGSRICEMIMYFPRGVNPAVAVSYNNVGNASMRNGASLQNLTQASLPYKIANGGAFRPPVYRQEDLQPLSRIRRPNTVIPSVASFVDFSQRLINPTCAEKTTGVKNSISTIYATAPSSFNMNLPLVEPFEVKYVIKNPLNTSVETNLIAPGGGKYLENTEMSTDSYTKDVLQGQFTTNLTGDHLKNDHIHRDILLSRTTPLAQGYTNVSKDIYVKNVEREPKEVKQNRPIGSTKGVTPITKIDMSSVPINKYIKPTLNYGEYEDKLGAGFPSGALKPTTQREGEMHFGNIQKQSTLKKAAQQHEGRYSSEQKPFFTMS